MKFELKKKDLINLLRGVNVVSYVVMAQFVKEHYIYVISSHGGEDVTWNERKLMNMSSKSLYKLYEYLKVNNKK